MIRAISDSIDWTLRNDWLIAFVAVSLGMLAGYLVSP